MNCFRTKQTIEDLKQISRLISESVEASQYPETVTCLKLAQIESVLENIAVSLAYIADLKTLDQTTALIAKPTETDIESIRQALKKEG